MASAAPRSSLSNSSDRRYAALELFRRRAARALTLQRRRHHARQVFAQCCRHSFQSQRRQIPPAQHILQSEEGLPIGIGRRQLRIVQREDQSVRVGHPKKARRLNARAHFHAVGEHHADSHLVQHPRRILLAFLAHGLLLSGKRLGRIQHGRRSRPQVDRIGLRLHAVHGQGIEIAIGLFAVCRHQHRMRMIVNRLDTVDLRHQIRIRIRPRPLTRRQYRQYRHHAKESNVHSHFNPRPLTK